MSYRRSSDLLARARRVVPHGVYGHRRTFAFAGGLTEALPADYPHFISTASGCRVTDVDGNEYIDYLCGYGPMVVGYGNERIEAAAARERARGISYDLPGETYVELAELLVRTQRAADWAVFALNGTDALALSLAVARAQTGREPVVIARDAFHGNQTWSRTGPGWAADDLRLTRTVSWGDEAELARVLSEEPVAAVVLCPYEQLVGEDNRMPPPGYWDAVRRHCARSGALLVIDDIRAGFRLHRAGSCAYFGIEPDLVCLSKAMANGYPVAAVTGAEAARAGAEAVFVSGTFWGYAPALAAALETIEILQTTDALEHMARMGRRLIEGLEKLAAGHGFGLRVTGPDALPMVLFEGDHEYRLARRFAQEVAHRGSLVHPTHNWFMSAAHRPEDIDLTLEHAEGAFGALR